MYSYGTSPRKYYPNENDNNFRTREVKRKKVKKQITNTNINTKKVNEAIRQKEKAAKKSLNIKIFVFIVLFASGALLSLYNDSIIDKKFIAINDSKEKITKYEKENSQMELNLQNNLSLTNIEKAAKERLGMQKISKDNTVYVDLERNDYIEPVIVNRVTTEEKNLIEKISDILNRIFESE